MLWWMFIVIKQMIIYFYFYSFEENGLENKLNVKLYEKKKIRRLLI